jgi:hypothetical protein
VWLDVPRTTWLVWLATAPAPIATEPSALAVACVPIETVFDAVILAPAA